MSSSNMYHSFNRMFTVLHPNICDLCLPLKWKDFSLYSDFGFSSFVFKFLCISEHYLKKENQFLLSNLNVYKVVSICSRSESLRGGVCILAGCDLPVEPVNLFNNYAIEGYF